MKHHAAGLLLCMAVASGAETLARLVPQSPFEAMVLAMLIGVVLAPLTRRWPGLEAGIGFAVKWPLEMAVALMGAALSAKVLAGLGWPLFAAILATVLVALAGGFAIGRLLGLHWRMALLVASGNAICGNSAILAVAPVIGARAEDVSAAVAFTAVLGIVMVLALPLLPLNEMDYGIVAGLSVYAVPQVLAATSAVGPLALQMGTVVKLSRVLLLGPLVLAAALLLGEKRSSAAGIALLPWYIVVFLALLALRTVGVLPPEWLAPIAGASRALGIVAMAALGLSVDLPALVRAGPRVSATVVMSLTLIIGVSLLVIRWL